MTRILKGNADLVPARHAFLAGMKGSHPIVLPDGRVPCDLCDAAITTEEAERHFDAWCQHLCNHCAGDYADANPDTAREAAATAVDIAHPSAPPRHPLRADRSGAAGRCAMSRPAPLELYIANPAWDGAHHHAMLHDPATGRVLMSAQEHGHDAALERLLAHKKHSKVARRRYIVKSNQPAAVIGLLDLINFAEVSTNLDAERDETHITLPIEAVIGRLRDAIAVIEGGAP